jgi:8-oxo-dGTP pyrophosphatase MutT (NUDIX family)
MRKERSAGAIIFFESQGKREYLLLNYLGGHWSFAKGHIEISENPIITTLREVKEETGLEIKIIKGFERKTNYSFKHRGEIIIKEVIFYLAKAKTRKVILSDEHKGYVWLPFKQALYLLTYKEDKNNLKDAEFFIRKLKKFKNSGLKNKHLNFNKAKIENEEENNKS